MYFLAEASTSVPVGWVLGSMVGLAGTISYLARIIYNLQQKQVDTLREEVEQVSQINNERAKTIDSQGKIILNLQSDIAGLKKGCGVTGCHWIHTLG